MTVEKVGRAMSWSVIARVAGFAAGMAANIIVVRSLGAYNWGIISALQSIGGFVAAIVALGLGNAILKFLPEMRVRGDLPGFFRNIRRLIVIQIVVWLALMVLAHLFGDRLGQFFNDRYNRFGIYLQFAVAFMIFEIFNLLITNVLQSWYETKMLAIVTVITRACYILLLILFIMSGLGVIGYILAAAAANLGTCIALLPLARRLVGGEGETAGSPPSTRRILLFSLPFVVTGILNQIVWRHSEVILLGHFHDLEIAGMFGLAYRIPQLMLEFIPMTIWPIVLAGASEVYSRNRGDLPDAIDTYYRLLFILVMPVAAMGFAFARPFIPILYGSEMVPAALLTQMFFVVFSYSFIYTPLSMTLYVMGKSWINMLVFSFLAVVNIGLDLALIPRYGLWGAFFPVSAAFIAGVATFAIVVGRVKPDVKIPVAFIARCYTAAVPAALLSLTSARWSSAPALAVQIVAGLFLLIAGFRLMGVIGEKEKGLIRKLPLPLKERILSVF